MLLYARHAIINFCTALIQKHTNEMYSSTLPGFGEISHLQQNPFLAGFQKLPSIASLICVWMSNLSSALEKCCCHM